MQANQRGDHTDGRRPGASPAGRWVVGIAGLLTLGIDLVYLYVIFHQQVVSRFPSARVGLVAACLALAGADLVGSIAVRSPARIIMLSAAAAMLVVWGVLALWSIGLGLLVAALLCFRAMYLDRRGVPPKVWFSSAVAAVAVIASVGVGLTLTD